MRKGNHFTPVGDPAAIRRSAVDGAEYPWRAVNPQEQIRNGVSLASRCIANETKRGAADPRQPVFRIFVTGRREGVELCAEVCGLLAARVLVLAPAMRSLFLADPGLVYWELKALGPHHIGPYHLLIQHATGIINEYFNQLPGALRRMDELEGILREARAVEEREALEPEGFAESLPARAD
jgi:hypothetical protein